jgi:hypothetical protein
VDRKPSVPLPKPLAGALAANASLAQLTARVAESNRRLAAVAAVLPGNLRNEVQAGPLDEEGWSLLASNAAVAAKLRHCLPHVAEALRAAGWRELPIRVRLRSR